MGIVFEDDEELPDNEDVMSEEEKRWFKRMKRLFKDMPKTVEIQVHYEHIQMNRVGARDETFQRVGDADNVPSLDWFAVDRVYPCSESV